MSMLKTAVEVMRATNASKLDVAALKDGLTSELNIVKADVAVIRGNYATKQELAAVKADVEVIRENYVTRADLAALETRMLKWFIASTATVVATMLSIALAASRLIL